MTNTPSPQNSEILIYQTPDGKIKLDVRLQEETVWISQEQMAILFGKGRSTITEHIQNVFKEGELEEKVVCREFRHTTQHGAIEGKTQERAMKKSEDEYVKFKQTLQQLEKEQSLKEIEEDIKKLEKLKK
jgi:hypothetical protein